MTVPATPRRAGPFYGNGSATQFPFGFKVYARSDVLFTVALPSGDAAPLVLDTDYSVTLNANQDTAPGGYVTYPISGSPLPVGGVAAITGNLQYTQPTDLPDGGAYRARNVETMGDRIVMLVQQIKEALGRTFTFPPTDGIIPVFPPLAERANRLLGFDANGQFIGVLPVSGSATALALDLADTSVLSKGDALVGVKHPSGGGVARTQHDKNLDWVSVKDFGAVGDGNANDTAAMQAAHNASFNVYYPAGYYKAAGKIQLRPGTRIQGESAGQTVFVLQADMVGELDSFFECKVAAANFDTQQAGVTVRDVSIIGDAHFGHGFLLQNIRFPIFDNVWINNFVGSALLIDYAEEGHFDFLNVNNCGRTSGNPNVTADTTYGQITFHRSANAVPAVSSNFLRFNGCTIANGKCSGDIMVKASSPSRIYFNDCQSEISGASIGNRDWLIGGNMGGIFFFKNNDVVNYRNCFDKVHFMEIYATDNRVTNSTKYYVGANGTGAYTGKGNRTNGAIDYVSINAFDAVNDTFGAASFQYLFNVSLVGCRMDSLLVNDVSGAPSLRVVACQITGNVTVNDFPYNGLIAFNVIGGNASLANCLVFGNRVSGTDTQNTATTQVPRKPVTNATAAAAMTLPINSDVIFVNGTTTITSIANPGPFAGRLITLVFNNTVTVTKGNNLLINSNFAATAEDTLTLVGDGINLRECTRSVN